MDNLLGEFIGTTILITFGCGVVANVSLKGSKGENSGWIVITAAWGFGVIMGAFTSTALGAPQADLNPALTLAKTLNGIYTGTQALATMCVQILGAILGAVIVYIAYLPHWALTDDEKTKLGVFATIPAVRNYGYNFTCEFIGTFILIFLIFAIFNPNNGSFPSGLGTYIVGILIWAIGLSLGGPTGYAINPARDLGPRIAHALLPISGKGESDWRYAWIPIIAPMLASISAYSIAKILNII